MQRTKIYLAATIAALLYQPFASAQLLQRLEQRLNNVADKLAQPPAENGAPVAAPGYLGLVADETARQMGVVVLSVKAGSPAEAAGLKKDDMISAINGQAVNNLNDFQGALDQVAAGQRAQFTVLRGSDALTLNATLVARQTPPVNRLGAEDPGPPPGAADPLGPAAGPAPNAAAARGSLGISVVQLTEQTRAAYGLATTRGALVAGVKVGGPAERAGIPVGAAIVAIDGKRVNTPDEVVDTVAASRPGEEIELSYYRGATLTRKTVRLAPAALDARAMPANPAGPSAILGGAGDRPIVRRVGEVIDNLARPAGGAPAGMIDEVNALKSQVELLQASIRTLEERLNRLEGKAAPQGNDAAAPADPVRKLELRLAPPDKPALPTPPPVP